MFNQAKKILDMQAKLLKACEDATTTMGVEAQKFFTANFRKQGFDDNGVERWKPRKVTRYRTRGGRVVDDTTRGILIGKGSGTLRKSIRYMKTSRFTVRIYIAGTADKYAHVHNYGLTSGRGFKMPKRQFIGDSRNLDEKLRKMVNQRIRNAFYK